MKTASDLPDELAREVKIRAAQQGRKLKDVIAELLRRGLDARDEATPEPSSLLAVDPRTGLLVVTCRHPASDKDRLTAERVAKVLWDQEVEWSLEVSRQ